MKDQEAFDTVVRHLLQQRAVSTNQEHELHRATGTNVCAYRGDEGRKCAIGILIPDELYKPEMENKAIEKIVKTFNLSVLAGVNEQLLVQLQELHDSCEIEAWPSQFAWVGREFKLKLDVVFEETPSFAIWAWDKLRQHVCVGSIKRDQWQYLRRISYNEKLWMWVLDFEECYDSESLFEDGMIAADFCPWCGVPLELCAKV